MRVILRHVVRKIKLCTNHHFEFSRTPRGKSQSHDSASPTSPRTLTQPPRTMSDESTSIRDGCVAPRVSDPDDTMVGTLGPTETEAGTSPKGEGDAPAEHIGPEPEQLKRKSFAVPGYHYIRRVVDTMVGTLGPTETEAQASPREDDDAPAEHIGPEPEQLKRKVVGVPGYHYIRRARSGRFEVQIKGVGQGSRGGVHLGTVDQIQCKELSSKMESSLTTT